jgi:hypothetical protein
VAKRASRKAKHMKKRQNKTVEGAERNDNFWKWIGKKIIRQMVVKEGWDRVEGIRPKRCYDNIVKRGGGKGDNKGIHWRQNVAS